MEAEIPGVCLAQAKEVAEESLQEESRVAAGVLVRAALVFKLEVHEARVMRAFRCHYYLR